MKYSVDELLDVHVSPAMKAAGYARSGRKFVRFGSSGTASVLAFRRFDLEEAFGFLADWSIVPAAMQDYYRGPRGKPNSVQIEWGLVYKGLKPVNGWGNPTAGGYWTYPHSVEAQDHCGEDLREIMESTWIPRWAELTENREALVWEILFAKTPPFNHANWTADPWRTLFLYIDDGDPDEMNRLISQLERDRPGSREGAWFRDRLALRLS